MAKTYVGLLNGDQTSHQRRQSCFYHSVLKESEWEVNLLVSTQAAGVKNIMPNFFGTSYGTSTITTIQYYCHEEQD